MNIWTEHRNPEGRTYWFNTGTKESVWEKPDDLKTPFERALNQTPWKEYFSGGRKYYYNTDTRVSKWEMPDELLLLLEKVEKDGMANAPPQPSNLAAPPPASAGLPAAPHMIAPAFTPQSNALVSLNDPLAQNPGMDGLNHNGTPSGLPLNAASILPARPNLPDEPTIPHNGFATVEEGEKAFTYLLRKAGVDENWTWDQTMRAIITDPLYKALNSLAEKKAAWQKYVDNLKAKEQEEREARLAKTRPAIRNMLKGNPNVFHYTTFPTADKLFAQHPIWQQAKVEAERKLIFEEYVAELKQREVQDARAAHGRAIGKLVALFKQLDVDVLTRWRSAHALVLESEEWKNDEELQKLPNLDLLLAFEDYSRVKEREFDEQMRRTQIDKTRRERKAREAFKDLLKGLVDSGAIKARTKWKTVYPSFADDNRYLDILGNPGSNPLELFWDVVDDLDQRLDAKMVIVEGAIRRYNAKLDASAKEARVKKEEGDKVKKEEEGEDRVKKEEEEEEVRHFAVLPETTEEEFMKVIREDEDEKLLRMKEDELEEVFQTMHDEALKRQADERRRAERKLRHMQDDLRYAMKKLADPIDVNMGYEEAIPLIEHLPEYKALDDESRRAAFSKFAKRQKERLRELSEDGGSTTSRKRKEPIPHREPERERERPSEREREPVKEKEKEKEKEKDRGGERERDRDSRGDYRDSSARERDRHTDRSDRDRDRGGEREREREREYDPRERDRSSRYGHHKGSHDDYRSSREYGRESTRDRERERDWDRDSGRDYRDRDKERERYAGYRERGSGSSKHHREYAAERDDKRRRSRDPVVLADERLEERAEKRPRVDREPTPPPKVEEKAPEPPKREETPEEGEI